MVKAEELRIGNLVCESTSSPPRQVTAQLLGELAEGWLIAHPVALTPEILQEWCGFEKSLIEKNSWSKFYGNGFDFFVLFKEDGYFYSTLKGDYMSDYLDDTGAAFHHLHQLQNLYFALTGEELPVSIPQTA